MAGDDASVAEERSQASRIIAPRDLPEQPPCAWWRPWPRADGALTADCPQEHKRLVESARQLAVDLRNARTYFGYSRNRLAQAAQVGRQRIIDIEEGHTWTAELITLHRIATALDATLRIGGRNGQLIELVVRASPDYRPEGPRSRPKGAPRYQLLKPYLRARVQLDRRFTLTFDQLEVLVDGVIPAEDRAPAAWRRGSWLAEHWRDTGAVPDNEDTWEGDAVHFRSRRLQPR